MKTLKTTIKELGIVNAEDVFKKIIRYKEDLVRNRKWGQLVSNNFEDVFEEMIKDTMFLIRLIEKKEMNRVVDIGSGGGIVGIPLGIACEWMEVTMIERSIRKSAFLAEQVSKLEIVNAKVICDDVKNIIGKEKYDIALTRGVGKIENIAGVALELLDIGGKYITIKGSEAEKEAGVAEESIEENGGRLIGIRRRIEGEEETKERAAIVVIEKVM